MGVLSPARVPKNAGLRYTVPLAATAGLSVSAAACAIAAAFLRAVASEV